MLPDVVGEVYYQMSLGDVYYQRLLGDVHYQMLLGEFTTRGCWVSLLLDVVG